jgi:hypothetical protein
VGGGVAHALNRRIAFTADIRHRAFEPRHTLPVFMAASWDVPAANLLLIQAGIAVR